MHSAVLLAKSDSRTVAIWERFLNDQAVSLANDEGIGRSSVEGIMPICPAINE
jgi:hypothetical protein